MPKKQASFHDFRAGWITDLVPEHFPTNGLRIADNIDIEEGSLRQRKGTSPVFGPFAGQVEQTIEWKRNNGQTVNLAVIGTNFCKINDDRTTTVIKQVTSKISWTIFQDKFYFMDGSDLYAYDGVSIGAVKPAVPQTAPTLTTYAISPEGFNGTYKFKVKYFTSHDGTASYYYSEETTVTAVDIGVFIWSISRPPGTPIYTELYRTIANGLELKRVKNINGYEATFYDSTKDDDLKSGFGSITSPGWTAPGISMVKKAETFNGTYQAMVTFVNTEGQESEASPIAIAEANGWSFIYWEDIPIGPEGTVSRKLYRSKSNENNLYFVAEIKNNTDTEYQDLNRDENLTEEYATDTNIAPIKRCKHIVQNPKNFRFYAAGDPQNPYVLFYSEPNEPQNWKEVSRLVPTSAKGKIVGLAMFADALLVFLEQGVWAWKGIDPDSDAQWEELPTAESPVSNATVQLTTNALTFLGKGGLISFSPALLGMSSTLTLGREFVTNLATDKVTKVVQSITNPENTCAAFDPRTRVYYLAYSDQPGATRNNKILVYDTEKGSFTRYTGLTANDIVVRTNGEVWLATENYVLKFDDVKHDIFPDGTEKPINYSVEFPKTSLGDAFRNKKLEQFFLSMRNVEGASLTVQVLVDDKVVNEMTFSPTGTEEIVVPRFSIFGVGRHVSVRVNHSELDKSIEVYGYSLVFELISNSYGSWV